jgi:Flp pilus assembly pilin Flp
MQAINELSYRTVVALQNMKLAVEERMKDEEGQTAVEYAGILALIATIFVLLFGLGLDNTISTAVKNAVSKITSGH